MSEKKSNSYADNWNLVEWSNENEPLLGEVLISPLPEYVL